MLNWIRKILKKKFWGWVLLIPVALGYWGIPYPQTWAQTMTLFADINEWIIGHAVYPGIFGISLAVFLGIVVIPWVRDFINHTVAIKNLWKLRSIGISFRNDARKVTNDFEYFLWSKKYKKWRKRVLKESKRVSVHLYGWLERLNIVDKDKVPIELIQFQDKNGDFWAEYKSTCEILDRLERYLVKHKVLHE